ncbi:hypothetical protein SARC_04514 [Sphaeroforma arctica JP610]|uniref:Etoposide-induced protein 2.4 n=1 Tax=Sphaeroforma arctica JP610 TaxID=667725 RepID=A0A0L0G323_9EUKA|nr:hypothetical protein SARC_04514 [Sphaeroforma arctica JP610]KNC83236.1 hypothetical protein SARC_04514 [Sphaeroforma arctica JP610]|eukprot:XP_014157138.1 hypothetical protein SARC_04514 [Sphaeroforma arctica JP610]
MSRNKGVIKNAGTDWQAVTIVLTTSFLEGVADSLAFPKVSTVLEKSERISTRVQRCVIINLVLFLGCLHLLDGYVVSFFYFILKTIWGWSSGQGDEPEAAKLLLQYTYNLIWVYPIYCLSFILNSVWYQDIAEDTYNLLFNGSSTRERASTNVSVISAISSKAAETTISLLLETMVALLVTGLNLVPHVGPTLSFILMCWLYALYCFEFKWSSFRWSLDKRLAFIEDRWPYFLGFGLPLSCVTVFSSRFLSSGLFAILYPAFLILATATNPEARSSESKAPFRIPIFTLPQLINKCFFFFFK